MTAHEGWIYIFIHLNSLLDVGKLSDSQPGGFIPKVSDRGIKSIAGWMRSMVDSGRSGKRRISFYIHEK